MGQKCPYCEQEVVVEWDNAAEVSGSQAKQWSCPECDKIVGVTEVFD